MKKILDKLKILTGRKLSIIERCKITGLYPAFESEIPNAYRQGNTFVKTRRWGSYENEFMIEDTMEYDLDGLLVKKETNFFDGEKTEHTITLYYPHGRFIGKKFTQ